MFKMMSGFPREKIMLIKSDQTVIKDIDALFTASTVLIEDVTIKIEDGDYMLRTLPNGIEEKYLIIDNGYFGGSGHGIPAHYQVKAKKITNIQEMDRNIVNNYNFSGANKVNINSTDNSTTNVTYNNNDTKLFEDLINTANSIEKSDEIIAAINEMREHVGKKTFVGKYNDFIGVIANHMTVFLPFVPALTQLITNIQS